MLVSSNLSFNKKFKNANPIDRFFFYIMPEQINYYVR